MNNQTDETNSKHKTGPGRPDEYSADDHSQLQSQLRSLESRDWQLWYIGATLSILLTAGVVSCLLPELVAKVGLGRIERQSLPQLITGLAVMVALLNLYLIQQRRALRSTRELLLQQIMRTEAAQRVSWVDPLTGAYNRRYLEEALAREASRASRSGSPFSVLLIDLDGFKDINSKHGHLVGDQVLYEVADLLKRTLRSSDIVARFGGDEFVVILPDTNGAEATDVVLRIEGEVEQFNRRTSGRPYRMAFSIGLAPSGSGQSTDDLLAAADKNMYAAKAAGKGQGAGSWSVGSAAAKGESDLIAPLKTICSAAQFAEVGTESAQR